MKIWTTTIIVVLCAAGCAPGTPSEDDEPNTTTSGDAVGPCSDPQLAYEPIGATCYEPLRVETGGILAGRVEPFAVDTICRSVIVSLSTEGRCSEPPTLQVAAWSDASPTPSLTTPFVDLAPADALSVEPFTPTMRQLTFALEQHYAAGTYPFVGVWTDATTCVVGAAPQCEEGRAWVRSGGTWSTLFAAAGYTDQIVAGVADCAPEVTP